MNFQWTQVKRELEPVQGEDARREGTPTSQERRVEDLHRQTLLSRVESSVQSKLVALRPQLLSFIPGPGPLAHRRKQSCLRRKRRRGPSPPSFPRSPPKERSEKITVAGRRKEHSLSLLLTDFIFRIAHLEASWGWRPVNRVYPEGNKRSEEFREGAMTWSRRDPNGHLGCQYSLHGYCSTQNPLDGQEYHRELNL